LQDSILQVLEGTSRHLRPILRDEAYRIAGEAVRNALNFNRDHPAAGERQVHPRRASL